jgi:hypothetical protein
VNTTNQTIKSDKTGIASAVICSVHCLVIPALLLIKINTNSVVAWNLPEWWHSLDYIFLLVGFYAVYHSSQHAHSNYIKVSLWVFWIILAIAIIFEKSLYWMAYIASAGLITTHSINLRRIRKVRMRKLQQLWKHYRGKKYLTFWVCQLLKSSLTFIS